MIVPHKHLSHIRTLKLHMSSRNNHHRNRVTTIQLLRSAILLLYLLRKTILVILEAVIKTCALIPILNTQKNTHIDVCKNLFSAVSVCNLHSLFLLFSFFPHTQLFFFFISWRETHLNSEHQQLENSIKERLTCTQNGPICLQSLPPLRFFGERSLLTNADAVPAILVFAR